MSNKSFLRWALIFGLASVVLSGCGQKGPLYLPGPNHAPSKSQKQ